MTRRTEFDPMSSTATGEPATMRPFTAFDLALAFAEMLVAIFAPGEPGRGFFLRCATARQTGVCHEIFVGVERLFARCRLYARGCAVGQEAPALFVVVEIGDHDLVEHLLVHRRIEDRAQRFDPAVEI